MVAGLHEQTHTPDLPDQELAGLSGSTSKRWRSEPSSSPAVASATPPMLPELLDRIPPEQEIGGVTADGAYDTRKCHDAIADRGAAAVIPPRKNAEPWKPNTAGAVARNEDAPCETAAAAPHDARLRPSGR